MKIAIIPARGGSKRIPRKNIKPFAGRPMISYAIDAARQSRLFDRVLVSTDDAEIAAVALEFGAEVPFERPQNLADDQTPTVPVIAHAIEFCRNAGCDVSFACCIYPCVPFIDVGDMIATLEQLENSETDYSFPIAEFPSAVQRSFRRSPQGQVIPLFPENQLTRTQDLEQAYYDVGQFYWGSVRAWLSNNRIHSSGTGFIIPRWRAVDIDVLEDWHLAELLFEALSKRVQS